MSSSPAEGESSSVTILPEEERDHAAVHQVNLCAFETTLEADLVDAVRPSARPLISLVAEFEDGALKGLRGTVEYLPEFETA